MFNQWTKRTGSQAGAANEADKVRDEVEQAKQAAGARAPVTSPQAGPAKGPDKNGSHTGDAGSNGSPKPSDTIFNKPAPKGAAKKVSEVLGEIVWLMSQSPLHKQFFISDLEWFVMTPVLLQQFRMFYADEKPIGVVFWGTVSEEVEQRLAQGVGKLRPQDWKSGDRLWVREAIAPFCKAEEMARDLKMKVFPQRS